MLYRPLFFAKHTHTHTHTHIYIYIYIRITCDVVLLVFSLHQKNRSTTINFFLARWRHLVRSTSCSSDKYRPSLYLSSARCRAFLIALSTVAIGVARHYILRSLYALLSIHTISYGMHFFEGHRPNKTN